MSCPYYWWNNHFACRKSGKDVSEDIYYKYCRNYDYSDCPVYRQQVPSDSRCYLTTACIRAMRLPDDCKELTVLRAFRDTHLQNTEEGKIAIRHYYEIAPVIVAAIDGRLDAELIYSSLYDDLVCPCVSMISDGQFEEAFHLYKEITLKLEKTFVCNGSGSVGLQRMTVNGR